MSEYTIDAFTKMVSAKKKQFTTKANEFSQAKMEAREYEEGLKPCYAQCFLEAEGGTVEERKMRAYASDLYREYRGKMNAARKRSDIAYFELELARHDLDLVQSFHAWKREIMRQGG